jgi:hypothetical protein
MPFTGLLDHWDWNMLAVIAINKAYMFRKRGVGNLDH